MLLLQSGRSSIEILKRDEFAALCGARYPCTLARARGSVAAAASRGEAAGTWSRITWNLPLEDGPTCNQLA